MLRTKSIGKGILVILLAVFTFACSTTKSMTRQDGEDSKPDLNFKIALWTDREDQIYELGENIYLFFAADKDCHLKLIHISSDGEETVLMPNKYQADSMAKAGYIYQIPSKNASFTFKAREPVGEGIIKAVATLVEDKALHGEKDVETEAQEIDPGSVNSKKRAEHEITINIVQKRP